MNRVAHYCRLAPNGSLPDVSELKPYKAVVIPNALYTTAWQDEVSQWLVKSGCLYMMAWGPSGTTWDNSVDFAVIDAHPGEETPNDKFVMTTWHDDETLEEVFWYAQFCANFSYDEVELVNTLILDISPIDREDELLSLFRSSYSLADRQPEEVRPSKPLGWLRTLFRV